MISILRSRYGSKRGLLRAESYRLRGLTGAYRAFRQVDLHSIGRIVFVCQGNICRSPFAESCAQEHGLVSASFGLGAATGSEAHDVAVRTAASMGVDLTGHSATNIVDFHLKNDDLLMCFVPDHCKKLLTQIPSAGPPLIALAGMWLTPSWPYIQDPYGLSSSYFATCFNRIRRIVSRLAPQLTNCQYTERL